MRQQRENTAALNTQRAVVWFDDFEGPNQYRFLSNFYEGDPIYLPSRVSDTPYKTGEHLFAALKARNVRDHRLIRDADGPQDAKTLGRRVALRDDWEAIKYDAMRVVLRFKFAANRPEAELLLQTGDALLVEGTYWNDKTWGVDLRRRTPEAAYGRNWLGTLLMARRAELRALELCGWEPDIEHALDRVF